MKSQPIWHRLRTLLGGALAAALACTCALRADAAGGEVLALRGATLHPVSGPEIASGTVVVEGGEITALGAEVAVPDGAQVVDLTGKHLYPGFVHPLSVLGLVEIGSVRGTVDVTEVSDVNTELRAEVAWNGDSLLLPVAMAGGVLTAHVAPRGGIFAGTSAAMRLRGWNWQDMTLAAPVGMHLRFPEMVAPDDEEEDDDAPSAEERRKERDEDLRLIDDTFADARAYAKARGAGASPVDFNPELEPLLPVLRGELPLFLHAEERTQIAAALDWAEEQGLDRLVLVTGPDARYLADRLAARRIPVILNGVLDLPQRPWEPYDAAYAAAAALHDAGVRVAIGDGGHAFAAANARNLPFNAAMAAAFGLPKDEALRSVTLTPAEILGIADRVGSLDAGKDATFMVTDGDPLEILTRVERVWVRGEEIDLTADHQWRLYQKYRNRPAPTAPRQ